MKKKSIIDQLAEQAKVKVYKPYPGSDDRKSLCGEKLQKGYNDAGEEVHFFEIPAGQADYIDKAFKKYTMSEPYIPAPAKNMKAASEKE